MKRVKAPLDKTAIGFDKTAIGLDKTATGLDNMAIGLGRLDKTAIDLDKMARRGWKWLGPAADKFLYGVIGAWPSVAQIRSGHWAATWQKPLITSKGLPFRRGKSVPALQSFA